jgi:hypothetical protein
MYVAAHPALGFEASVHICGAVPYRIPSEGVLTGTDTVSIYVYLVRGWASLLWQGAGHDTG